MFQVSDITDLHYWNLWECFSLLFLLFFFKKIFFKNTKKIKNQIQFLAISAELSYRFTALSLLSVISSKSIEVRNFLFETSVPKLFSVFIHKLFNYFYFTVLKDVRITCEVVFPEAWDESLSWNYFNIFILAIEACQWCKYQKIIYYIVRIPLKFILWLTRRDVISGNLWWFSRLNRWWQG